MAEPIDATIPSFCNVCGDPYPRRPTNHAGCCSVACLNKSRADHSPETLMRRLWDKVDRAPGFGPRGDCWRWTARIDGRGYGEIKVAGRYKKAHRIVLFGVADLDNPLFACHRCDNPACVNPDHLFPGEAVDNVRDMHTKGRAPRQLGRRLTEDQVREIRCSAQPQFVLAKRFGIDGTAIRQIRARTTYRDVI